MFDEQVTDQIQADVLDVIQKRRSRRAYDNRPIEAEKIKALFEAARWAPSSVNEQPWRYVYATSADQPLWNLIFESLHENNRAWAVNAPLLIASLAERYYSRTGAVNGSAHYDVGAANALLSLQATAMDLNVHQMGGFDRVRLIHNLSLPEHLEPIVVMAVGYPGDPAQLPERFAVRETSPRQRLTRDSFAANQLAARKPA